MKYIIKSSNVSNNIVNLNKYFKGHYKLSSFCFTNNIYNVNSNNNILPYQEGATYTAITLSEQFVDGNDLATDIASKINAVSAGTATATYNDNTGKFNITNTTNFYLKFGDVSTNTCNNLLGFNQSNTTDGTSVTSDNSSDLVPFKTIFIDIKEDKSKNILDENNNNNTFMIQGVSNFGELFIYNPVNMDIEPQYALFHSTKRLEIRFYDENENELTLRNWILILEH